MEGTLLDIEILVDLKVTKKFTRRQPIGKDALTIDGIRKSWQRYGEVLGRTNPQKGIMTKHEN